MLVRRRKRTKNKKLLDDEEEEEEEAEEMLWAQSQDFGWAQIGPVIHPQVVGVSIIHLGERRRGTQPDLFTIGELWWYERLSCFPPGRSGGQPIHPSGSTKNMKKLMSILENLSV